MRRWLLAAGAISCAGAGAIIALDADGGPAVVTGPQLHPGPAVEGRITLFRNVDPGFAEFIPDAAPPVRRFIIENFERLRGFPPFQNQALGWAPPTDAYQDLYAIYNDRNTRGKPNLDTLEVHPDWVLRDGAGNPLYIQFDCDGASCPQYAADPGNREWRADWIRRAKGHLARGYAGIYVDDVNLEIRVSDGSGEQVIPIDPRTGEEMTLEDWRRYMAEFTEQIREQIREEFPEAVISHNPLWFVDEDDRWAQRQIDAADYIQMERGFNDRGLTGSGRFGYDRYLEHVDYLHERGRHVIFKPIGLDRVSRVFEAASYLLVSDGGDRIAPQEFAEPGDFWAGWHTDLGPALGPRYRWRGLIRRDFQRGSALVNPPGSPPRRVGIPLGGKATGAAEVVGPRAALIFGPDGGVLHGGGR